jgi:hypothetical protein
MVRLTCLPTPVASWLHGLRPMFRPRHPLVCCWLLVSQAVSQENATLTGVARLAPRPIAAWHLRRLLTAAYGTWRVLLWWFADQAIAALPPPAERVCSWVVESRLKGKPGPPPPVAKKARLHEEAPDLFGLPRVMRILPWGNSRMPGDCELVRRQEDAR